jgi:hypothetical protein
MYLFLMGLILVFSQCTNRDEVTPEKIDYDEESAKLMKEVAPQVLGQWNLQQVHIKIQKKNEYHQSKLRLTRDTVFQNLGTLEIRRAAVPAFSSDDVRYPAFDGTLHFRGKALPVRLEMRAHHDRVVEKIGPQALFSLQYSFGVSSRSPQPEDMFLDDLGLIHDNYSLELVTGQPMIWRGLNRGVEKIILQRQ